MFQVADILIQRAVTLENSAVNSLREKRGLKMPADELNERIEAFIADLKQG